jgi:type IV pilus biogenesis protein CpaD/CtpE
MKVSAVHLLWLVLLAAVLMGVAGCASTDPDNDSVRPWDSAPDSTMMPLQDYQHGN